MLRIASACCLLTGCAEVQMGYNVLTYDEAVARTANQLLLLNAVRASQRYPRSFTGVGPAVANPPVSGSLASTLNLLPGGLQSYTLNPQLNAGAGYSQLTLGNLNTNEYTAAIRKPILPDITNSFYDDSSWPKELLDLIYIQSYRPSEQLVLFVDSARKSICGSKVSTNPRCPKINEHIAEFGTRCDDHFTRIDVRLNDLRRDPGLYYNTAANYCHFQRFRIFREELSLVERGQCKRPGPACAGATTRTPLAMIGYLGELIAAQNYGNDTFTPQVLIGISVGTRFEFDDAPLFVVNRGVSPGKAAVAVEHEGMFYIIPEPEFRSPTEARSLQSLDLVMQTLQAATHRDDLPKTLPSFAVVRGSS